MFLKAITTKSITRSFAMAAKFRYTVDNPLLTLEQRQFYEDNGFILIKNLIDHSLLDECAQHFRDLCDGKADRGTMTMMKDVSLKDTKAKGEFLYYKVQDIVWDEVFSKYISDKAAFWGIMRGRWLEPYVSVLIAGTTFSGMMIMKRVPAMRTETYGSNHLPRHNTPESRNIIELLDYVACFVGPDVTAMHSMLINKPPDSGKMTSTHPLHQDLHYFPFRPVDRIAAAWTAMEPVNEQNGCLVVLPGTHKGQLLQHDYPEWEGGVNKAFHGIRGFDLTPNVKLIMEKGDTAFFHPLLIHGSGPNLSSGFRKAISCHYSTTHYHHIDVTGTSQENIAKEVEEMARKRGIPAKFTDVWDYRSRAVRGNPRSSL